MIKDWGGWSVNGKGDSRIIRYLLNEIIMYP